MNIGDKVRVYRWMRVEIETCSFRLQHEVAVYSVKTLTIVDVRSELIKALNYDSDGWGDVLYATDAQGREYSKKPHWDGPRATVWMRSDKATFDQYPMHKFSRDLAGRVLTELLPPKKNIDDLLIRSVHHA